MNEEDVKNIDPRGADPAESNTPSSGTPPSTDAGKHSEIDLSTATDLPAVDSNETKSPATDLSTAVEVKPSDKTNLPVADSSEAKSTDLSVESHAAKPNTTTSLADSVNPTNSSAIKVDVVDSPGSAIEPSGTDDSNIAEGDSEEVGNTTETPNASDDDSPSSLFNRVSDNDDYMGDSSSYVDIFTLAERGTLGLEYSTEFPSFTSHPAAGANASFNQNPQWSDHGSGPNTSSEDQPMSGIDDETTMSSEGQLMSCIDDEMTLSSIQDSPGSDHDSGSWPSFQIDPPHSADQEDQEQAQEALSRKRNIQRLRRPLDVLGLQEESSSSELSAQNSPARRPFFKSIKRTKSAPKNLNQSAQSSKPDSTVCQNQDQAASSSEPQPSTSKTQDQPAESTEASSSSTRDQSQPAESSESSSARTQDQVADLSQPSTSSARAQDQRIVLSQPSTSARARDQQLVLSQPSTSSTRARGQRLVLSQPSTSFARARDRPLVLPRPSTSRAQDQQLVLYEHSTPFSRTWDADSLIPSTSFPRFQVREDELPIHLPESVIQQALVFARRLGLIVARVVYITPQPQYSKQELTQLMWNAMEAGDAITALYALKRGADLHHCPKPDWTALHGSVLTGDLDFSLELLERGAKVNRRDSPEGYTPLHLAAIWDKPNMAVLLLQNGARAAKKDFKGKKPLEYAVQRKHERTIEILNAAYVPDDSEDTEETEEEIVDSVDSDASDETNESL